MQPTTRGYSNTIPLPPPPPLLRLSFCFTEQDRPKRKSPYRLYSPFSNSDSQPRYRTNTRGTRNSKEENAGWVRRLPPKSRYAATSPAPDPSASAPLGRPASRPAVPGCGFSRPRVRGRGVRVRGFWMRFWCWLWLMRNGEPRWWDRGGGRFSLGRGG